MHIDRSTPYLNHEVQYLEMNQTGHQLAKNITCRFFFAYGNISCFHIHTKKLDL